MNLNHLPTVQLVDKNSQPIAMINQVQARRFLRQGLCDLLLMKPATVQFIKEISEWQYHLLNEPSRSKVQRLKRQYSLKSVLYGNYHMQSPEGEEMFHTNADRVLWYLSRDLVDIVGTDPPTLRFKYEPNGPGHIDDPYYLTEKINQCVVCGCDNHLTRHHVIPKTFRVLFPNNVKDHSYHDILLLCMSCHRKYEEQASYLKLKLMEEMGYESKAIFFAEVECMIKLSKTLLRYQQDIPEPKRTEMFDKVRKYLNKEDIGIDDLQGLSTKTAWLIPEDYQTPSEFIVANIKDLQEFSERWRQHFLNTMKPRFLPKNWDLHKSIYSKR